MEERVWRDGLAIISDSIFHGFQVHKHLNPDLPDTLRDVAPAAAGHGAALEERNYISQHHSQAVRPARLLRHKPSYVKLGVLNALLDSTY